MQYHTMPGGRRIAFRKLAGNAPTLMFLPGYMSDMAGGKAGAVMEWARRNGRACLLLDYSGCGASDGDFAKGTLTRWREEVGSLVGAQVNGRVVLIGSSMGGWLMLLVARLLGRQVAAMIGVAAAPDFTDWGYDAAQKAALASGRAVFEDNPYGPDPTPTHPAFWADGEAHKVLTGPIALTCPVRLLHGQQDDDVPWDVSLALARALDSDDVQVTLVKDGDHRLSRPGDIALLLRTIAALDEGGPETETSC